MKKQKHTLESLVIFILSRQKSITPNAHLCVATIGADFVYANSPQYFHEINSKIHTQLQRSRIFTTHSRVSILNIIWYSFTFGHKMPICIFEIEKVSLCDYNGAYVCVRRNRQRREDEMNVSTKRMRLENTAASTKMRFSVNSRQFRHEKLSVDSMRFTDVYSGIVITTTKSMTYR